MKNSATFLSMLLVVAMSFSAFAQDKAKIVFETQEHNFGTFKESAGIQTYTFKFTNTGKVPLILSSVTASCGCTTPKWTNQPVAPGGKGEVQVSYDPTGRPMPFSKSITVHSNAENTPVILTIIGTVLEKEKSIAETYPEKIGQLRVKASNIYLQKVYIDDVKKESFEMVNDSDSPVKVTVMQAQASTKVTITPETIPAGGKAMVNISFDAKANNVYGFVAQRVYLSLNGSNDYSYSFGVSTNVEEDFTKLTAEQVSNAPVVNFSELNFDFGEIKQDGSYDHTFTLMNKGKSDLYIRNLTSSCGCTVAALPKKVIAPGESVPVKVSFNAHGKRGRQSSSVTVITNDPKNPSTSLIISSNVITPQ